MSITDIFELNQDTFLVELRKENLSTIKEFATLIKRDKGGPGDTQARKKMKATKEFTFIYHYCSYKSEFINYSERDRRKKALINAELDPNLKIEEDNDLMAAIEVFKVLQETASLKMLNEIREGLHVSYKVVKKIRQDLEKQLDVLDIDELQEVQEGGKIKLVDPIARIKDRLDMIISTAKELPKTLKSIDELEETVKKELSNAPNLRGGSTKGTMEDPKPLQVSNPLDNL